MKMFTSKVTLEELKAQLKKQYGTDWKHVYNDKGYKNGDDYVHFMFYKDNKDPLVTVTYYPHNGWFYVYQQNPDKLIASHTSEELDNEEWYQRLLTFLYKEVTPNE